MTYKNKKYFIYIVQHHIDGLRSARVFRVKKNMPDLIGVCEFKAKFVSPLERDFMVIKWLEETGRIKKTHKYGTHFHCRCV